MEAHRFFDLVWKKGPYGAKPKMSRSKAYRWLRGEMKLSDSKAHFSRFDIAQCEQAIALVKKRFPEVRSLWDKLAAEDIFG